MLLYLLHLTKDTYLVHDLVMFIVYLLRKFRLTARKLVFKLDSSGEKWFSNFKSILSRVLEWNTKYGRLVNLLLFSVVFVALVRIIPEPMKYVKENKDNF